MFSGNKYFSQPIPKERRMPRHDIAHNIMPDIGLLS